MIPTQVAKPALHPELAPVVDAFATAGVRWLLLRTPDGGLSTPRGDIDLLVHPRDLALAARLACRVGFAKAPRRGRDVHLLRYSVHTDQWLWLHITSSLHFGNEPLPLEGPHGCITRRQFDELLPRAEPDTSFWLLLWHCLAEKAQVAPHHRPALRIGAVAADCSGRFARAFARTVGSPVITATLLDAIVHDNWSAVDAEIPACVTARNAAMSRNVTTRLARGIARRGSALMHWRERRGLSVALLGPDGAGKTTLATGICSSVPFPSRVIYMGLTGGALRYIRRTRVPGLVFVASACVIWARYLRAWSHMVRGRLVVFDRYVYDAVAPPGYTPRFLERVGRRLSRHLCPSPDLVLLLDAPGAVMYARKGEHDPDTLERWRQHFRSLQSRLSRLHCLDAAQAATAVRVEAVEHIWQLYAQTWTQSSARSPRRTS